MATVFPQKQNLQIFLRYCHFRNNFKRSKVTQSILPQPKTHSNVYIRCPKREKSRDILDPKVQKVTSTDGVLQTHFLFLDTNTWEENFRRYFCRPRSKWMWQRWKHLLSNEGTGTATVECFDFGSCEATMFTWHIWWTVSHTSWTYFTPSSGK